MSHQHYRSQFGDTTFTKVFVGGLAWETPTEEMRLYFEQFGEILEAVIISDKTTGRSKGYGFVTFRDPESARRACAEPNPVIDGRRANCNIASLGRPRPSPPRGRSQGGGSQYQGAMQSPTSYSRVLPPPPPPPLLYPPYGYATYPPEYGYQQTMYNPHFATQYYHQMYSTSSSTVGPHYPYAGYGFQTPAASFSSPPAHRMQVPPYVHYSLPVEASAAGPSPPHSSFLPVAPFRQAGPTSDLQTTQPSSASATVTRATGAVISPESSNT